MLAEAHAEGGLVGEAGLAGDLADAVVAELQGHFCKKVLTQRVVPLV